MDYADVMRLVESHQSETATLDYKNGAALGRQNDQRDGLMKEVLGFANSGGGMLVYGVQTFADRQRKHIPERLAPVTDAAVTVEWIQQMVNSHSTPRFSDFSITQITCPDGGGRLFVIEVRQAMTAHQAPDGLYYQRAGLETLKMTDPQIRDVMNRRAGVQVEFEFRHVWQHRGGDEHRYDLVPILKNVGNLSAERWRLQVEIPQAAVNGEVLTNRAAIYARSPIHRVQVTISGAPYLKLVYPYSIFSRVGMDDLHPGDELEFLESTGVVFPIPITVNTPIHRTVGGQAIFWRVAASHSSPISGEVAFRDWCNF